MKRLLANTGVDAAAFRDECGVLQAGNGSGNRGRGHKVLSAARDDFLHQVGTRNDESAAQAGHSVDFGEGAQNDNIFAGLDEIERGWRFAQVDVGFVDQNDRVFRLVSDEILDVGVRCERARGVVGIADIEDACVRPGCQHGLDVVRVAFGERNLDYARASHRSHMHACLKTRICSDVTFLRRSEGQHTETQRWS